MIQPIKKEARVWSRYISKSSANLDLDLSLKIHDVNCKGLEATPKILAVVASGRWVYILIHWNTCEFYMRQEIPIYVRIHNYPYGMLILLCPMSHPPPPRMELAWVWGFFFFSWLQKYRISFWKLVYFKMTINSDFFFIVCVPNLLHQVCITFIIWK